jgi:periplasmic divalent cation tolerance protein
MDGAVSDLRLLYITCADAAQAEQLARGVIAAGHAACANLLPGMTSIYPWQGRVETSTECVLILKTTAARAAACRAAVVATHPYQIPCVLELPISDAHGPYAAWLRELVGG